MINKNVEADLYTAQAFEAMGGALTTSILLAGGLPDSDGSHGWTGYQERDPSNAMRRRRAASIDFWTD